MPTTEIEVLKAFVKMPLVKIFIVLMLLPSVVFGWLWYDNQKIILEQQKECNQKVEKIYKELLDKTEKQIDKIREIEKKTERTNE